MSTHRRRAGDPLAGRRGGWHVIDVESATRLPGLVAALEADLGADGCRLLQVKTLGATHPDPGYARTRAFYRAVGFLPLEETDALWPRNPCLILVKPLPAAR